MAGEVAVVGGMVAAWYGSSMLSATGSKELLEGGEVVGMLGSKGLSALELTCAQMGVAAVCASALSVLVHGGSAKALGVKDKDQFLRTLALAVVFSTGFITLNLAYALMSTSLANTLRAMEPLSSLVLAWGMGTERVPAPLVLAVLPIVAGAALASYGNASFELLGLGYCVVANFAFALRTIQYKQLRAEYGTDHASLFAQTCFLSALLLAGAVLFGEAPERVAFLLSILRAPRAAFVKALAVNGFTFFLYLQLSFATLSYISVVSHAILNSFRRPAIIVFDVLVHGTQLSEVNAAGVAIASLGVTAYSVLKARLAAQQPKQAGEGETPLAKKPAPRPKAD